MTDYAYLVVYLKLCGKKKKKKKKKEAERKIEIIEKEKG